MRKIQASYSSQRGERILHFIMPRMRFFVPSGLVVSALLVLGAPRTGGAADSVSAPASRLEETNNQEALRAYLQVQEQLHATQLAVEESRKEAREASAQAAEKLTERLHNIEQALASQRARELEAMQSTNRVMVIVAGSFATLGFLAMLLMAYFQWRTVNGLAEISSALPGGPRELGAGRAMGALGAGDSGAMAGGATAQSNLRLLGAMEQLEKRIFDLEHTSRPELKLGLRAEASPEVSDEPHSNGTASPSGPEIENSNRAAVLMEKGQSLLSLNNGEEALRCFEQVLELEPKHGEALVKKGLALEKLQRLDEALACYDLAIAADGAMTIAYLQKGGLFNRMERFTEALECYEKALRTQEKRAA